MQISDFCKEHNVAYLDILVEELLNIENQGVLINRVAEITDERVLYLLGYSYNWDNGFAVPKAIIKNPNLLLRIQKKKSNLRITNQADLPKF